mmetsp:Transcript_49896/g.159638  ORF Transcript_49896/g.159638 Transcript_49896/m.159638 type:complete len:333 (+) Transcript_49896:3391-4389(+)
MRSRSQVAVPTPTFPRASVDVTVKLCTPAARSVKEFSTASPEVLCGSNTWGTPQRTSIPSSAQTLVQLVQGAPTLKISIRIFASPERVPAGGELTTVTVGGLESAIQRHAAPGTSTLPAGSVAATTNSKSLTIPPEPMPWNETVPPPPASPHAWGSNTRMLVLRSRTEHLNVQKEHAPPDAVSEVSHDRVTGSPPRTVPRGPPTTTVAGALRSTVNTTELEPPWDPEALSEYSTEKECSPSETSSKVIGLAQPPRSNSSSLHVYEQSKHSAPSRLVVHENVASDARVMSGGVESKVMAPALGSTTHENVSSVGLPTASDAITRRVCSPAANP